MALKIKSTDSQKGPIGSPEKKVLNQKGYKTDKWGALLSSYQNAFGHLAGEKISLLEIGVFEGESLKMWRDYFTRGTIVGLDMNKIHIDDDSGRVRIYQGLQQDVGLLDRIRQAEAVEGFDIVIDDGSHMGDPTRASFWHLFQNHLKSGGIYVIEDWGTGYWEKWSDGQCYVPGQNHLAGMVGFLKELVDECGMSAITHPSFGNPQVKKRAPLIQRLEIYAGYAFVHKV